MFDTALLYPLRLQVNGSLQVRKYNSYSMCVCAGLLELLAYYAQIILLSIVKKVTFYAPIIFNNAINFKNRLLRLSIHNTDCFIRMFHNVIVVLE